ncbi:GTP-binding protein [Trichlorobacter ammonificans]|uniref:Mutual gliding-motility protein MglA n=1 Tax=Trichlorobacter ammonificans TaxID=2916410 RepID=A0ABN8HK30_9BACT|nr:GTPase domain-containing protein [Trichlorobacter ammonificans]CAH2031574.1 Mutual gliding-motility protein MglA [Trichlorobacter ammonificans]
MIEFDERRNKLVLKLVYYGPALSGKTTNLLCLHDRLEQEGRGELMMLDTTEDRTIYFDLLPFFYEAPSGLKIKLKVFTVPGQVRHDATRKAVLQRADGVVFVADSRTGMMGINGESFANLEQNLALVGLAIETVPLVVQFNKRDLPDIVAEDELRATWRESGLAVMMASALQGQGVIETFGKAVELLFDAVDAKLHLRERYGVDRAAFLRAMVRL